MEFNNTNIKSFCEELKKNIKLNRKILFVNPPVFNLNNFELKVAKNRGYYNYPPTGLQYLKNSLKDKDLEIDIFDLNYEVLKKVNTDENFDPKNWMELFYEKVKSKDYSIVGLSNFFNVDSPYFVAMGKFLMKSNKYIVIAGGQNATYNSKKFLQDKVCHFVLERESENKINFLFDLIYNNPVKKPTPGIAFIFNNELMKSEGEKDIVELKGTLIDSYKDIPIENYCKYGSLSPYSRMSGVDTYFAGILLNRGCRGNCKFCDVGDFMNHNLRSRDANDFLTELEYLAKERKIGFFEFLDDDFTRNKTLALEVLNGIIEKKLDIKWGSNNGFVASNIDEELMKAIQDSGCIGFKIGVESGNKDILQKICKPGTLDTFMKFSSIAQKFPKVFIVDNYILGFPGETFEQMKNSLDFSLKMNLDWSSFAIYQQNVGSSEDGERDMKNIKDFIPTKEQDLGKLKESREKIEGMEIFKIDDNTLPSREQLEEIWFTLTILRNYVYNKNLIDEGDPMKFISWTNKIEERYPTHPYINFFLALANNLIGNFQESKKQIEKMNQNLKDPYWEKRMNLYKFDKVIEKFPRDIKDTMEAIDFLRKENEWK